MSGSTVGGVLGAAVGFYFGGPQGAQWGWMIGSAIGGYVDPMKIEGPRLTDATVQTSRDGVPITIGYGTFPTTGNVIWQGPLVEHKKTETQGKGGPKVTSYTYTRSYAIGICEGPIAGVLVVKRNGKIVYDVRTGEDVAKPDPDQIFPSEENDGPTTQTIKALLRKLSVLSMGFLRNGTFYLGTEDQLPDPTMEAVLGVGNVPAHRGMAYLVVKDDDLTESSGAIPQYEFVVSKSGASSVSSRSGGLVLSLDMEPGPDASVLLDRSVHASTAPLTGSTYRSNEEQFGGSFSLRLQSGGAAFVGDQFAMQHDLDGAVDSFHLRLQVRRPAESAATSHVHNLVAIARCEPDDPSVVLSRMSLGIDLSISPGRLVWNDDDFGEKWSSDAGVVPADTWTQIDIRGTPNGFAWDIAVDVGGVLVSPAMTSRLTSPALDKSWKVEIGNVAQSESVVADVFVDDLEMAVNMAVGDGVAFPGLPGAYVLADGTIIGADVPTLARAPALLSAVLEDIVTRAGLAPEELDVSLIEGSVDGYRLASEAGADAFIAPLMSAHFFDVSEWDAKLRFVPRGRDAAFSLNLDDYVARDSEPVTRTLVQEAELLRRVTVGYLDPATLYTPTTQKWERRAATVEARGEASTEIPLVCTATVAARIAEKRGKSAWSEPEKLRFRLPTRLARLTPTDVGVVALPDGSTPRVRLLRVDDEGGVLDIEAVRDRQAAYNGTATGVLPPVSLPNPQLLGPTQVVVMDLAVLRDADDALGVYVAARGYLPGWPGAVVQASADSGASYTDLMAAGRAATIGATTTALAASIWPDGQRLTVALDSAPASLGYEGLLRYGNRAALRSDDGSWEVLQFETSTANGDGTYTLDGLVRGRYDTAQGAAAVGAMFVLLDDSVAFVPLERWVLGTPMLVRGVTLGTDADAAVASTVTVAGVSQTEWPVHGVTATRDGSDTVTVSWVGRARLGAETTPFHSRYFTGYRVTFSDGFIADTTTQSYARPSTPADVTVTVAALNSITGPGPSSEALSV